MQPDSKRAVEHSDMNAKRERRSRKLGQDDKWNFCLTAAIIAVNRRNHEQTTPAEPLTGLQGEGGSGRRQGRPNHRPTGGGVRGPSEPDSDREIAAGGKRFRDFRTGRRDTGHAGGRCEVAARQDRRADAGERFFRRRAHQGGMAERKAMIDREHDLPITKQAEILKVSRGSVYYLPRPVSSVGLAIMQRLDRLHLEFPFAGSRVLRGPLGAEGGKIGGRHVEAPLERGWGERRSTAVRAPPSPSPATRSIRTCCAASRSGGRTRSGPWTSRTFRWRTASSISPSCSTGRPAACCHGGCRSRWRRRSASRRWRMLWPVTAGRTSSIPIRGRSSRARRSPVCLPATASPSAWMAKGPCGTTCSLSGCGVASNTRRSICEPMKASARPVARSADISTSTIAVAHIRALTTAPRIKPTSIFLRSARRPNPGRGSTYRRGIFVQTTGTSSLACPYQISTMP